MDATASESTQQSGLTKHRVLLELGQGGMSNVYLAVARGPGDFHKLVVLKVLRADLAQDPAFRSMALGEAKIAARLNHPNVVQTYEVLNEGERPVIVMEYLEGQPLSSVLSRARDGTLTLAMSLQILVDALSGLHHAHELSDYDGTPFGLVHRDFTPHNIFLGYDGHVKIIDFGIAKTGLTEPDSRTGTIKGKVRYMAPEQIVGAPEVDRRADIFAAGMVLWELATRESPWKDAEEIAVINHVINDELPSMRKLAPSVPEAIERICSKAIQFDRENRYATAAEMATDIEQVLAKLSERVLPRDLGRVVTAHFGDVRASTKRVIEEQLAKSQRDDASLALLSIPMLYVGDRPASRDASGSTTREGQKVGRPRRAALLGLAVAAVAALGLLLRPHSDGPAADAGVSTLPTLSTQASSAPTSSVPPEASVPPAASAGRQVEIDVRATPASAVISFDGEMAATNPAVSLRAADGARLTVRAQAPGYLPRTVEIVVDRGADLVIKLDREPPVPGHPLAGATASVHGAASASPTKAPDCNPPYYIDGNGIKKFKPTCL
jgi:serine/threonine protein kinase